VINKISALLEGLSLADLEAATPIQRRRFGDLCRHWWQLAERRLEPKAGVLKDLKDGKRSE
jgi:hypothetical protein